MADIRISDLKDADRLLDGHMFIIADGQKDNFSLTMDKLYEYLKKKFLAGLDERDLADRIYPIGSMYIQAQNANLPFSDIFTWTLVSKGRCIQTRRAGRAPGEEIPPGAPAIIESVKLNPEVLRHTHKVIDPGHRHSTSNLCGRNEKAHNAYQTETFPSYSMSWTEYSKTGIRIGPAVYNTDKLKDISIKLIHDADALYGKSDTVQPPAFLVNIYKRTA